MEVERLAACVMAEGKSYIIIQAFFKMTAGNLPITNELECPLVEETHRFVVLSSRNVLIWFMSVTATALFPSHLRSKLKEKQ